MSPLLCVFWPSLLNHSQSEVLSRSSGGGGAQWWRRMSTTIISTRAINIVFVAFSFRLLGPSREPAGWIILLPFQVSQKYASPLHVPSTIWSAMPWFEHYGVFRKVARATLSDGVQPESDISALTLSSPFFFLGCCFFKELGVKNIPENLWEYCLYVPMPFDILCLFLFMSFFSPCASLKTLHPQVLSLASENPPPRGLRTGFLLLINEGRRPQWVSWAGRGKHCRLCGGGVVQ